MSGTVNLALAAAILLSTGVPAQDESSAIAKAERFLGNARLGNLPASIGVYLNVGKAQKVISGDDTAGFLKSCAEGALQEEQIPNRDGSLTPREVYVTTRFTCAGELKSYSGAAGVILLKDGEIFRLVLQVDGYAPAFSGGVRR